MERKAATKTRVHTVYKRGRELGKVGSQAYALFAIRTCPTCGDKQWMEIRKGTFKRRQCRKCYFATLKGETHNAWNGGRFKDKWGYIHIWLPKTDFFHSMCNRTGYVAEHRLVVAKSLGRCLQLWEIVHHKEGFAKDDNRYPETLQLVTDDRHKQITILGNRISYLEQRVSLLEADNTLLRSQLDANQIESSYTI